MPDTKLTALPDQPAATTDDIVYLVDNPGTAPVSKKITVANLLALAAPYGIVSLTPALLAILEDVANQQVTFTINPFILEYAWQSAPANTSIAIPAAVAEWPNRQRRDKIDLSGMTQARIIVATSSPALPAGSKLAFRYALTDGGAYGYLDGASGPVVAVDVANSTQVSPWVALEAGAKADVFLQLAALGGDASTTGISIGRIALQVKP